MRWPSGCTWFLRRVLRSLDRTVDYRLGLPTNTEWRPPIPPNNPTSLALAPRGRVTLRARTGTRRIEKLHIRDNLGESWLRHRAASARGSSGFVGGSVVAFVLQLKAEAYHVPVQRAENAAAITKCNRLLRICARYHRGQEPRTAPRTKTGFSCAAPAALRRRNASTRPRTGQPHARTLSPSGGEYENRVDVPVQRGSLQARR